jgi:uncharacterized membrane protein (UPF0127 family)
LASSFLSAIIRAPDGAFALRNSRNSQLLATSVEPAFDSRSRRRGLLGRDRLDPGAALIIGPCSSIHTFFMRFAIDVVFAAKDGRVMKSYAAIPARRIAFAWGAYVAIELPAGTVAGCDTRAGDQLELVTL